MRGVWAGGLVVLLAILTSAVAAEEDEPRGSPPAAPATDAAADALRAVSLGRPVPLAEEPPGPLGDRVAGATPIKPVSFSEPEPLTSTSPAPAPLPNTSNPPPAPLSPTALASNTPPPVSANYQAPEPPPPALNLPLPPAGPIPGPAAEPYNCGVVNQPPGAGGRSWWDKTKDFCGGFPWFGKGDAFEANDHHHWFCSDHEFPGVISPVSNPFFFEDPRSLTEVRPIFMYNATPTKNPIFHGGDIEFFGLQARLAFNECWSLVISEFGFISMEPHFANQDFQPHTGFAAIKIGPKWTFLRNESSGTLAAAGLTFDIPVGDRKVFQDTGSLGLVPYITAAQSFGHTGYGTFHAMGTLGFDFGVDSKRSDDFFTSLHLDFDIGDLHKLFPLIELNNFLYISNGKREDINFEGRDLANFGARHISGHDELSLAAGMRYRLNENINFGLVAEVPLTNNRDLLDYRITLDVIFRY